MFKNMSIVFTCVEDTSFQKGEFDFNREGLRFRVQRFKSGATEYGDCSAHSVEIVNRPNYATRYFDTRYERISIEKEIWIQTWKNYLEREYLLKVEPDLETYITYREEVK